MSRHTVQQELTNKKPLQGTLPFLLEHNVPFRSILEPFPNKKKTTPATSTNKRYCNQQVCFVRVFITPRLLSARAFSRQNKHFTSNRINSEQRSVVVLCRSHKSERERGREKESEKENATSDKAHWRLGRPGCFSCVAAITQNAPWRFCFWSEEVKSFPRCLNAKKMSQKFNVFFYVLPVHSTPTLYAPPWKNMPWSSCGGWTCFGWKETKHERLE